MTAVSVMPYPWTKFALGKRDIARSRMAAGIGAAPYTIDLTLVTSVSEKAGWL